MVAAARRPRTASARSSDTDPQYFVLDPDELSVEEEEEEEGEGEEVQDSAADAAARGGKSPEEENAENADKETTSSGTSGSGHLNNSCHEIPLRPSRETPHSVRGGIGNAGAEINNTGNTSWP